MEDWKAEWAAEEADTARRDEYFERLAQAHARAGIPLRKIDMKTGFAKVPWYARAWRKIGGRERLAAKAMKTRAELEAKAVAKRTCPLCGARPGRPCIKQGPLVAAGLPCSPHEARVALVR